jgi:hypothetical protein
MRAIAAIAAPRGGGRDLRLSRFRDRQSRYWLLSLFRWRRSAIRAQEPRFRCSRCDAHCIRSIHEFDLVLVIALHKQAKARRKRPHSLPCRLARLPLCVGLFGIGHGVGYLQNLDLLSLRCDESKSGFRTISSLSQEHQRIVRCNCHDPGAEVAFGAKSRQMPERAHQRLLEDILCVFIVANDAAYPPLQRGPVTAAQLQECVLVAAPGRRDEVCIAGSLITHAMVIALA